MEKELIPYEQALALKELGFDDPCFGFYSKIYGLMMVKTSGSSSLYKDAGECLSPTYQQAFRWFREKYNLDGSMSVDVWNKKTTSYRITGGIVGVVEASSYGHLYDIDSRDYNTYEEAELECLNKLIEIVKEKL